MRTHPRSRPSRKPNQVRSDSGNVATFSLNSSSACVHTRALDRSFNCKRLGSNAVLNISELSRGRRDGRWSMLITLKGSLVLEAGNLTGTVGLSKVVVMAYTGMGL